MADDNDDEDDDAPDQPAADEHDAMAAARAAVEADRIAAQHDEEDEEIILDRAQCPTASGAHGDACQLVVHVAQKLDFSPADIHQNAEGLFGEPLPCQCDDDHADADTDCPYTQAWSTSRIPIGRSIS